MIKIEREQIWVPSRADLLRETAFIGTQLQEIGLEKLATTIETAVKFRNNAYAPYSGYAVGAGLLTIDGKLSGGCNGEGVNYSITNHAEGVAIGKAISDGAAKENRKFIKALAISHDSDSGPCGECLQRLVEHADNCLTMITDPNGKVRRITSLLAILPYNFNPSHLGK